MQKEFVGTESKSETEKFLRKAMEDYEEKKFIAKAENTTLGDLLDVWAEENLKTGSLSNGSERLTSLINKGKLIIQLDKQRFVGIISFICDRCFVSPLPLSSPYWLPCPRRSARDRACRTSCFQTNMSFSRFL